ncbi:homeobox-DDT domain protein RLT3 isoform X1 [Pistacia vera]|uniref:homeobox-DDT domain protein RLT3 isoform X1 n=1 Tax=Pistacia vera TaxID=55513 RepID=UPI001262D70B|nr:homeobox-DDT domain protein RLT3 isoform X1 [Pistacia vera]
MKVKRKSPLQVQALKKYYSAEEKYPTKGEMEDLAAALDLTFKQVRTWFIEKRRRDKSDDGLVFPSTRKKFLDPCGRNVTQQDSVLRNRDKSNPSSSSKYKQLSSMLESGIGKRKRNNILLQDLLPPTYILKKVFRKDGPPLGVEFDALPLQALCRWKDSANSNPALKENQRTVKRRKVSKQDGLDYQDCYTKRDPVRKHGVGKGLMTVWRVVNPNGGSFPTGISSTDRQDSDVPQTTTRASRKQPLRKKRAQQLVSLLKQRRLASKLQEKRKPSLKRRQVKLSRDESPRQPHKEKCELALEGPISQERLDQIAMLVDDEELELRELEAGTNSLICCDHVSTNGRHGCSLCGDLLAKFPPNSVKMKQPFGAQPWDSSPEAVKKLFKVFHFLYTYSSTVDICSFTLDEFAQSFHDKDSILLGKIHVALLKLLLSDVVMELSRGRLAHLSVSCKFLALLHSVENKEFLVELWNGFLNPLTWTEILRQILVAAGFGSKQGSAQRESLSKEMVLMLKYGLRLGTLKGELFRILLEQGNNGLKVSQLAKTSQIVELNLACTTQELELLISSTLSSDISLFEKISSSSYRLRINTSKEVNDFESDTEDSGSVDDNSNGSDPCSSGDDSEYDSENHNRRRLKHVNSRNSKNSMLTVYSEIDESHPGEAWLLGLMEGEYFDLSIEEKLNALVSLIDLVSAGSTIRMEDPTKAIVESVPSVHLHGSGAKIKRSSSTQHRPSWIHDGQTHGVISYTSSDSRPVDSSLLTSHGNEKYSSHGKEAKETEAFNDLHPMQSVYLGSDRRYNRYWLFLGPCNAYDSGHKSVYFESSEDGHWEVIDTEEALRALLSVLDDRGRREALLIESLEKREAFLCQAMSSRLVNNPEIRQLAQSDRSELDIVREDSSSPVSDVDNNLNLIEITTDSVPPSGAIVLEVGKKGEEHTQKWSRLQAFDMWIWNSFYLNLNAVKHGKRSYLDALTRCESCHDLYWRDEKHCRICHTTFELDFDLEERYAIHAATCRGRADNDIVPKYKILSSQLQSLKAAIHAIESVMPEDALVGAWTKCAHRLWVKRLRRTSSLAELLQVVADFVGAINEEWLCQWNVAQGGNAVMEEIIVCFPTMPQTSSALALWLVKLDALIAPYLEKVHSEKQLTTRCRGKCAVDQ